MAGTPATQARSFRFGPFEFDVRAGELRKHSVRIKLREQPVRILLMLLDHPGEVVLHEEIRLRSTSSDVATVSAGRLATLCLPAPWLYRATARASTSRRRWSSGIPTSSTSG
jgi:hypothetical protein